VPIAVTCPGCGKRYRLRDDLAGKRVKCKCGSAVVVPGAASGGDSPEAAYGLAPLPESDPGADLLRAEVPPDAAGPVLRRPAPSAAEKASQAEADARAQRRARQRSRRRRVVILATAGVIAAVAAAGIGAFVGIRAMLRPGYPTPAEAFAAHQQALAQREWEQQFRTLDAESQAAVAGMLAVFAQSMAATGSEIRAVLNKHGIEQQPEPQGEEDGDALFDYEQFTRQMAQRRQELASKIHDKPRFYGDLMRAIRAEQDKQAPNNPVLRLMAQKQRADARRAVAGGELVGLEIDGDRARGTLCITVEREKIEYPIAFQRVGGRWFLHVAESGEFADEAFVGAL